VLRAPPELRLAALSLTGHSDPARFAAEFAGTERTVAEYLLAEVLDRQSEPVRRLLLRTSVLRRVNDELADLLTGDTGGERALQDLERTNAFVVPLDAARYWFRYHQMFADLLQLELRRTAPGEVAALHQAAAGWFAEHRFPVDAIRHAQAARDWTLATRLLTDHWPGLHLDGQDATTHELLAGFPLSVRLADAQLAAVTAADELAHGSVQSAQQYLQLAEHGMPSVPDGRRPRPARAQALTVVPVAGQSNDHYWPWWPPDLSVRRCPRPPPSAASLFVRSTFGAIINRALGACSHT
jgi:LuxR family maltose regulon positive regulatory protein